LLLEVDSPLLLLEFFELSALFGSLDLVPLLFLGSGFLDSKPIFHLGHLLFIFLIFWHNLLLLGLALLSFRFLRSDRS